MQQILGAQGTVAARSLESGSSAEVLRIAVLEARTAHEQTVSDLRELSGDGLQKAEAKEQHARGRWREAVDAWERVEGAGADVCTMWLVLRGCASKVGAWAQIREQWRADLISEIATVVRSHCWCVKLLAVRESYTDAVVQVQIGPGVDDLYHSVKGLSLIHI
eukprot:TRINITY_DN41449_c0_g1_i2.p1 TRINITY_DN41449_c0_g1~~TRINITY_DN41449_c0_g1_i2.p1  ORF type:complete len:163 (-),score=45.87 TRINITY_DN41449_c0_g1_i2:93-581(-)